MTVVDSSRNLLADAAFSVLPEHFPWLSTCDVVGVPVPLWYLRHWA
jgi:hypothetical protein